MFIEKPFRGVLYETEEVRGQGCCFSQLSTGYRSPYLINPSKTRIYSEPKQSKSRKIELITPKKGLSHGKQTTNTNRSLSHQKISTQCQQKIVTPKMITTINYSSKHATPKNSLKASKIIFNNNTKSNRLSTQKNQQQIPPCQKIQVLPNNTPRHLQSQFLGISEISLVPQQFISQGSAANIVNLITNQQQVMKNEVNIIKNYAQPQTFRDYIYSNCFKVKDQKTPVEKIMDRKKYEVKAQNRRKKIVN